MARPMNNVRMMDRSASGCRDSASRALHIALPMANAGRMTPIVIARQAATVDAIINQVMSVIAYFLVFSVPELLGLQTAGYIYQCQHAEKVSLHQGFNNMQHQDRNRRQETGNE